MLYIIYVEGPCLIILLHQDLSWTLGCVSFSLKVLFL